DGSCPATPHGRGQDRGPDGSGRAPVAGREASDGTGRDADPTRRDGGGDGTPKRGPPSPTPAGAGSGAPRDLDSEIARLSGSELREALTRAYSDVGAETPAGQAIQAALVLRRTNDPSFEQVGRAALA